MININLDASALRGIADLVDPDKIRSAAESALSQTAASVHAHIIEKANGRLHSRLRPFLDGLTIQQENDNTWVIALDKKVRWIDDGMEPHSMVEDLLSDRGSSKGKVHTSAEGHRWRVIPFAHGPGKGATSTTPAQQSLIATVRTEMKKREIPFGAIEQGANGGARLGLLHSFDIMHGPKKTHEGPGQGWGAIGHPRQGPTGIPFLQGVRVYQHNVKNSKGEDHVRRSVMTFRIVSSKHAGTNRWWHPGLPAERLFEEAEDWARKEWETNVVPALIRSLVG